MLLQGEDEASESIDAQVVKQVVLQAIKNWGGPAHQG